MSNLEYQDGLGDLLREKEKHSFNWARTVTITLVIISVVILSIFIVFLIGKALFGSRTEHPGIPDHVIQKMDKMEKEMDQQNLAISSTPSTQVTPSISTVHSSTSTTPNPKLAPVDSTKKETKLPSPKKVEKPNLNSQKQTAPKPHKPTVAPPVILTKKDAPQKISIEKSIQKPVAKQTVSKPTPFKVIVGTFSDKKAAQQEQARLKSLGIETYAWLSDSGDTKGSIMLQSGAFTSESEANRMKEQLVKKGLSPRLIQK